MKILLISVRFLAPGSPTERGSWVEEATRGLNLPGSSPRAQRSFRAKTYCPQETNRWQEDECPGSCKAPVSRAPYSCQDQARTPLPQLHPPEWLCWPQPPAVNWLLCPPWATHPFSTHGTFTPGARWVLFPFLIPGLSHWPAPLTHSCSHPSLKPRRSSHNHQGAPRAEGICTRAWAEQQRGREESPLQI